MDYEVGVRAESRGAPRDERGQPETAVQEAWIAAVAVQSSEELAFGNRPDGGVSGEARPIRSCIDLKLLSFEVSFH